jgi:hypothetical protein
MTLAVTSTTELRATATAASTSSVRRRVGLALLATGTCGSLVWIGWRLATLPLHVIPIVAFLVELLGIAIGVVVAVAIASSGPARSVYVETGDRFGRYSWAVADLVGRTRAEDLHRDVRSVIRSSRHPGGRDRAEWALACVVIDGPRRLVLVAVAVIGLLLGVSPVPVPHPLVIVALAVGTVGLSLASVVLSGGRIRIGDRLRWSYGSLGEIVVSNDLDGVAPRRWVGTVATFVVVNMALALRGMSDRWTHGLPAMENDARIMAMLFALAIACGAWLTLLTTPAPELHNAHLVSRRLEERSARQLAIGAAFCVGLVGLLAGVLPGCVDPADDDAAGVEQVSQIELATAADD